MCIRDRDYIKELGGREHMEEIRFHTGSEAMDIILEYKLNQMCIRDRRAR